MTHKYFDGITSNPKINEQIDYNLIASTTNLKDIVRAKNE